MILRTVLVLAILLMAAPGAAETVGPIRTSAGPVLVERMAHPLASPWGFAFLPDGAVLVTERGGDLHLLDAGRLSPPLSGVPQVRARGQGGLLDVTTDPDFDANSRIYLSYSEPAPGGQSRTAVAAATLQRGDGVQHLSDVTVIFRQEPALRPGRHYGSRLVFADDGTLFVTIGDRGLPDLAQDMSTHVGKVVRINPDGTVPADNPYLGRAGIRPEIWSAGHRNPQGAAKRPADGAYFTISHGAAGGDEVNRPLAGRNYGWPRISYGTHYSGRRFPGQAADGLEQPLFFWDPSIAPSGAVFYDGPLFPAWQGDLLVGALKLRLISRLDVGSGRVREAERLFEDRFGRVRALGVAPDGAIWFATDRRDGALWRVIPAP